MPPGIPLSTAVEALSGALLIGLLIGVQRESISGAHPGLRDFLLISLSGGVCGLLGFPWLTAPMLLSIAILMAVFHYEDRLERTGITTELAGVSALALAYLAASPHLPYGEPLAIAMTLVIVIFLETKK